MQHGMLKACWCRADVTRHGLAGCLAASLSACAAGKAGVDPMLFAACRKIMSNRLVAKGLVRRYKVLSSRGCSAVNNAGMTSF